MELCFALLTNMIKKLDNHVSLYTSMKNLKKLNEQCKLQK